MVERLVYTERVGSSKLSGCTTKNFVTDTRTIGAAGAVHGYYSAYANGFTNAYGTDFAALNQFIEKHLALADSSSETLKSLRLNMLNQIKEK